MWGRKSNQMKQKKVYHFLKRFFDICVSLVALIILSPIFLIIAILIKLDSKGPVFFKHHRIGYKGKPIFIYKFRTMVDHAEDMIKTFTPEQKAEWEANYKLENDPRITKIGAFLRKTSIDELPQLLNIIGGSLSIVGPRPIIEEELEKYEVNKEKFLSAKPGLTGYWAAHGRSNTSYEERMRMELYYVDNCSLWLDIKIVLRTAFSVIKQEGAK